MIPFFTSADDELAVIAVAGRPLGFLAIGAEPTGVIAIGALATGVVAIGCGAARGLVVASCGVGAGGLVVVCGGGIGLMVGALGLGVSVLDGIGMSVGIWPGPFPRRGRAAPSIALAALEALPPEEPALVEVRVVRVTDGRVELDADARRVSAHLEGDARARAQDLVGERVLARLRSTRAPSDAASYRDAPDAELACDALLDRLGPTPPRLAWYARAIAAVVVTLGVAALTIPGIVW